jgi:hypothetical protein
MVFCNDEYKGAHQQKCFSDAVIQLDWILGATAVDIVSFIGLHFPYYNYRLAECEALVRSAFHLDTLDPTHKFRVSIETLVGTARKIETTVRENR